ncbi:MAG: DUF4838 domain-containing protein [Victivallales bacterium]|nr:DUF4838 domain-containing protein [Victivallales bacterium]
MKKLLMELALLLSLGVATAGQYEFFQGSARPARNIKFSGKLIALEPEKSGMAEIVVDSAASKVTRYAATELRNYLNALLRIEIPIVNVPTPGKFQFFIGISPFSRNAGIKDETLRRDAFIIKTVGNAVYILGIDSAETDPEYQIAKSGVWGQLYERGTLFGVYDFLERFGGVRFYFPGENGIYLPSPRPLSIPEIDIYDRPDYETRKYSVYSGQWDDEKPRTDPYAAHISPQKNQYYSYLRMETRYVPNNHGLSRLGYLARFGKSHPEYFALLSNGNRANDPALRFPGQLCYSSKIIDEIYLDAESLLRGEEPSVRGVVTQWGNSDWDPSGFLRPAKEYPGVFNMMPQDAFQPCRCPECVKHFNNDQASSNFIWEKTAAVANRLKANNIPGYVTQMAYNPYGEVPNVELPDNIMVMVGTTGAWKPNDTATQLKLIRDWNKKINRKVWLWNYSNKFGNLAMPGIPSATPRAIGKYYADLKNDIVGAFMESETDKLIYHYLNYYVFAKVCWDNNVNVDSLLKEHYLLMFGPGAAAMEKAFNRFESIWMEHIVGKTVETNIGPVSVVPPDNELWSKIYSPTELSSITADFDQALRLTAAGSTERKRIEYMRSAFLEPLLSAAKSYRQTNDTVAAFKIAIDSPLRLQVFGKSPAAPVETIATLKSDQENLHITFDCAEPFMADVVAAKRNIDDEDCWQDNGVEIFLNPAADRKSYYHLIVNSVGSLFDAAYKANGSNLLPDLSWQSEAKIDIRTTERGYQVNISIPRKNLGEFNPDAIVLNLNRNRVRKNHPTELYTWSPFLKNKYHEIEHFGTVLYKAFPSRSIVKDGDFAVVPQGHNVFGQWISAFNVIPGTKINLDETSFIAGGKSLRVEAKDVALDQYPGPYQHLPTMKPNTLYEVSFFVRCENVTPRTEHAGVFINIWDDKNLWFPMNPIIGSTPWIYQSFEFTSGPKTNVAPHQSFIKCALIGADGVAWFDHISLVEKTQQP